MGLEGIEKCAHAQTRHSLPGQTNTEVVIRCRKVGVLCPCVRVAAPSVSLLQFVLVHFICPTSPLSLSNTNPPFCPSLPRSLCQTRTVGVSAQPLPSSYPWNETPLPFPLWMLYSHAILHSLNCRVRVTCPPVSMSLPVHRCLIFPNRVPSALGRPCHTPLYQFRHHHNASWVHISGLPPHVWGRLTLRPSGHKVHGFEFRRHMSRVRDWELVSPAPWTGSQMEPHYSFSHWEGCVPVGQCCQIKNICLPGGQVLGILKPCYGKGHNKAGLKETNTVSANGLSPGVSGDRISVGR